jgi:hypothetical protein
MPRKVDSYKLTTIHVTFLFLQAARERAVEVSVAACVARLMAMDTAEQISRLRRRVNEIVASLGHTEGGYDRLQKEANKLLHAPTLQLREGSLSGEEIEDVAMTIEKKLISVSTSIEQR